MKITNFSSPKLTFGAKQRVQLHTQHIRSLLEKRGKANTEEEKARIATKIATLEIKKITRVRVKNQIEDMFKPIKTLFNVSPGTAMKRVAALQRYMTKLTAHAKKAK